MAQSKYNYKDADIDYIDGLGEMGSLRQDLVPEIRQL
jgi:hypothetical protein